MEISVIVPVYKAEQYLRQCVESILCQTFEDFELILVDDGSPDQSGAICDEYAEKDPRVSVIHQKMEAYPLRAMRGWMWQKASTLHSATVTTMWPAIGSRF